MWSTHNHGIKYIIYLPVSIYFHSTLLDSGVIILYHGADMKCMVVLSNKSFLNLWIIESLKLYIINTTIDQYGIQPGYLLWDFNFSLTDLITTAVSSLIFEVEGHRGQHLELTKLQRRSGVWQVHHKWRVFWSMMSVWEIYHQSLSSAR